MRRLTAVKILRSVAGTDPLRQEAAWSLRRLWICAAMVALVGCSEESPAGPNPDFVRTDITLVVPQVVVDEVAELVQATPTAITIHASSPGVSHNIFDEEPIPVDSDSYFSFEALCDGDVTRSRISVILRLDRGQDGPSHRWCYQYIGGGQLPCSVEPYTIPWEGTVGCWQS